MTKPTNGWHYPDDRPSPADQAEMEARDAEDREREARLSHKTRRPAHGRDAVLLVALSYLVTLGCILALVSAVVAGVLHKMGYL